MAKKIKKIHRKSRQVGTMRRTRSHAKLRAGKKKISKKPKKRVGILRPKKKIKKIIGKTRKIKAVKKVKARRITKKKPKKIIRKSKSRKVLRKKFKKPTRKKAVKKAKRARLHTKFAVGKKKRIRRRKKTKSVKPRVYIGKGALEQLFESQAKVKILKFFFRNSKDIFQPKDIFKRLRSNISLLRREINKLENIGVIKQKRAWLIFERKHGGIRKEKKLVYYLNPAFDFFNELRNLILKSTISSKDELINSVRKLGNIKLLILSGLFTGDEAAKVDLLIVGDKINHRKLNNFLKDLEAEVGKELNCAIMTTKEFNYRYDMYDRFVRDLITGKSEILINRINLW